MGQRQTNHMEKVTEASERRGNYRNSCQLIVSNYTLIISQHHSSAYKIKTTPKITNTQTSNASLPQCICKVILNLLLFFVKRHFLFSIPPPKRRIPKLLGN